MFFFFFWGGGGGRFGDLGVAWRVCLGFGGLFQKKGHTPSIRTLRTNIEDPFGKQNNRKNQVTRVESLNKSYLTKPHRNKKTCCFQTQRKLKKH